MRKIILNLAVSLDGFIEDAEGRFDWCMTDQDYGMTEFMDSVDTILFGRKSYELMKTMEEHPYPGKQKIVFSGTGKTFEDAVSISTDAESRIRELRESPGGNIFLFGGASLNAELLRWGLVDEMLLALHPVMLGGGKPVFEEVKERKSLRLLAAKTYDTGLVQLHYEFLRKADKD